MASDNGSMGGEPPGSEVYSHLGNTSDTGEISELPNNTQGKHVWKKEEYVLLIECHERAKLEPGKGRGQGVGRKTLRLWQEKGMFAITENKLMNQQRVIRKKGWLTEVEIERVKAQVLKEVEVVAHPDHLSMGTPMSGGAAGGTPRGAEGEVSCATGRSILAVSEEREWSELLETFDDVEEVEERDVAEMEEEGDDNGEGIEVIVGDARLNPEVIVEIPDELDHGQLNLLKRLEEIILFDEGKDPVNLRYFNRAEVSNAALKVDRILQYIPTRDITETRDLIRAASILVGEIVGLKPKKQRVKREPFWKRRIENDIKTLRKHLSKIDQWYKRGWKSGKESEKRMLERKYDIRKRGFRTVIEMLKQRISSKAVKVRRYSERNEQYHQNRLFTTNQKQFFRNLEGGVEENTAPDADEARDFWNGIWGESVSHNTEAEWIRSVREELANVPQQEPISIKCEDVKGQIRKLPNWKAPGIDGIQGYWLKKFKGLHEKIGLHLDVCLQSGVVPSWMVEGKTTLVMKDKTKGNVAGNYRPIACLNLLWKVFTGVFSDQTYNFLIQNDLLPVEQKGCRKGSRGTKDHLIIDKMILKDCKEHRKNLSMAWIDFKKAYDMVPHSWIVETLGMFGVAKNVIHTLRNSMPEWKTRLYVNNQHLANVNIKRGIFQGDAFSPLLFVIALIPITMVLKKVKMGYQLSKGPNDKKGCKGPLLNHMLFMDDLKLFSKTDREIDSLVETVRLCSSDIGMEFGISKCAVLSMKRGKRAVCQGIELPGEVMSDPDEGGYKYLGILELDDILHNEMKNKLRETYMKRLKLVLKSKLHARHIITAINTWAVAVIRYAAAIVKWNVDDIAELDRKTRKAMTMHGALHPKANINRLYMKRKRGGRGLISVEECVNSEKRNLKEYVANSKEELLKHVAKVRGVEKEKVEGKEEFKNRVQKEREEAIAQMPLHGQFERETGELKDREASWKWLAEGDLKACTESLIIAAQDQALHTNSVKYSIYHTSDTNKCRLCGEKVESVTHIVSACKTLAQKEYKRRHDKVCQNLHWLLCKKYEYDVTDRWYEHTPEKVLDEAGKPKILWDFDFQTDRIIEHRRPDMVLFKKDEQECFVIDVAIPGDQNIVNKATEKITKYAELKVEIARMWGLPERKVKVLPVIIGALGSIPKSLTKYLDQLDIKYDVRTLQKSALLGTAHILRKVLSI